MSRRFVLRKIVLKRLSSQTGHSEQNKRGVSKEVYTGVMFFGPSVGRSFTFYRDDAEYMHTSVVRHVEYVASDKVLVHTRNSVYELTIGKELDD